MNKQASSILIAVTLLMSAPLVHGTIYKWQDEQGITHFSQVPPPGGRFEIVPQPRLPPADPEAERRLEDLLQSQKQAEEDQKVKKKDQMKAAEEQATREESCRRAKEQLAVLESRPGSRIKITEPDGMQRRLTEEERQTRLVETQKQIADSCAE